MRRLTFAVQNGVIDLTADQEVDMLPLGTPQVAPDSRHAFWFELRDAANEVLAVQPQRDPMPEFIEVFSDDPAISASFAPDPRSVHTFSVVLPSVRGADAVVLKRSGTAQGTSLLALNTRDEGVEIARFKLTN